MMPLQNVRRAVALILRTLPAVYSIRMNLKQNGIRVGYLRFRTPRVADGPLHANVVTACRTFNSYVTGGRTRGPCVTIPRTLAAIMHFITAQLRLGRGGLFSQQPELLITRVQPMPPARAPLPRFRSISMRPGTVIELVPTTTSTGRRRYPTTSSLR